MPVDCIYEGERMSTSTPANASTAVPTCRSARSGRSAAKTTSRPVSPVRRRERRVLWPARLTRRRRQGQPAPYDTNHTASYVTGR